VAATRTLVSATYQSVVDEGTFTFVVTVDSNSISGVQSIRGPNGTYLDSMTSLPQTVVQDIQDAITQVEDQLAQTSDINGQLVFAGETTKAVVFVTPMGNTNYRVVTSVVDYVPVRVISKTTTGFTVETGVTYTGRVGYDVFV